MMDAGRWAFDIEANTFHIHLLTDIWCVCLVDVDTDEEIALHSEEAFTEFVHTRKPKCMIAHNGLGFDLMALNRLWGVEYTVGATDSLLGAEIELVDTFQLSSFLNPDRLGGHSLENLAKQAGSFKQAYTGGFDMWSQEMEDYCFQDCRGLAAVYKMLMKEAGQLLEKRDDVI